MHSFSGLRSPIEAHSRTQRQGTFLAQESAEASLNGASEASSPLAPSRHLLRLHKARARRTSSPTLYEYTALFLTGP
jgi:hypothetical protein